MVTVAIIASVLAIIGVAGAFIVLAGVANEFARLRWALSELESDMEDLRGEIADVDFVSNGANMKANAAMQGYVLQ